MTTVTAEALSLWFGRDGPGWYFLVAAYFVVIIYSRIVSLGLAPEWLEPHWLYEMMDDA